MEIEKIEKFIDAGYTKAEIEALENSGAKGGNDSGEAKKPDDASAGKEQGPANPENASKVAQPVEITAAIEALTNTVAGLKETVKAMQDKNIAGASTDNPNKDKVGDAIASFMEKF